jgi:hypothetical protein
VSEEHRRQQTKTEVEMKSGCEMRRKKNGNGWEEGLALFVSVVTSLSSDLMRDGAQPLS